MATIFVNFVHELISGADKRSQNIVSPDKMLQKNVTGQNENAVLTKYPYTKCHTEKMLSDKISWMTRGRTFNGMPSTYFNWVFWLKIGCDQVANKSKNIFQSAWKILKIKKSHYNIFLNTVIFEGLKLKKYKN